MNAHLKLPDQTLFIDKLLQVASLGYALSAIFLAGLLILSPNWPRLVQFGLVTLAAILMAYLHRRQNTKAREWLLSSLLIVVTFLGLSISPSLVLLSLLGYAAVIVIAALTATRRQTWLWCLACVAAYALAVWGRGYVPSFSSPDAWQPLLLYGAPIIALLAIALSANVLTNFTSEFYQRSAAAHAALVESSRQLAYQASLLDKVSDAIIAVDAAFTIQSWNAAAETIYGWSAAEATGQSVSSLLKTRYVEAEMAATARQNLIDDGAWKGEVMQAGRTRPNISILSSVTLIKDEQGQPAGAIAVNRDISDYKEAAEAVRVGEARYERLFMEAQRQTKELQLLSDVLQRLAREIDLAAILRSTVSAIHEAFGYPFIALYLWRDGQLWLQNQIGYTAWPERSAAGAGLTRQAIESERAQMIKEPTSAEERKALTPGATAAIAVPLLDEGRVAGVLGVEGTADTHLDERDLRLVQAVGEHLNLALERARLYATLQGSERRFRTLIENSSDIISIISREGTVLYTTPAIGRILGYTPAEHIGVNALDIVHPDDLPNSRSALANILTAPGATAQSTVRIRHADGSWRWLEGIAINFLDDPAVGGIVTNFRDISERRRAEEAIRQAEKLKSLGIMSGGIAHDYNNLLTVILTQLSLAQNLLANHPALTHLAKMRQAADRAAQLTDQLLAYSGRGQLQMEIIDVNAIVAEQAGPLSRALPATTRLTVDLAPTLPPVEGDVAQLQQALTNLVYNASEALGQQPGAITISTGVYELTDNGKHLSLYTDTPMQPGQYVTLTVADNGPGMTRALLSQIFDPFFTTKFTGRGLGLPVVVGIVRAWGGGLQVDSQPEQGATFTLYLPASAQPVNTSPVAPESVAVHQATSGEVLVVDDEAAVREAIADLLSLEEITTLAVASGEEALRVFQERPHSIRVVLLDLSMPGLSGEETLARLHEIRPNLPIIPMSGYSETQVRTRVKDGQIAGFLAKPFRAEELVSLIRRFLRT